MLQFQNHYSSDSGTKPRLLSVTSPPVSCSSGHRTFTAIYFQWHCPRSI